MAMTADLEDLRRYILEGLDRSTRGDYARFSDRFTADARVVWRVGRTVCVGGSPKEFADYLGTHPLLDPPPPADVVIERLEMDAVDPDIAHADVLATGPDGQRSRLVYRFQRAPSGWLVASLEGQFVDDGAAALDKPAG